MTVVLATLRAGDVARAEAHPGPIPRSWRSGIHGVQNTPPAEMLETDPENVRADDSATISDLSGEARGPTRNPVSRDRGVLVGRSGADRRRRRPAAAIGRAVVHVGWFLLFRTRSRTSRTGPGGSGTEERRLQDLERRLRCRDRPSLRPPPHADRRGGILLGRNRPRRHPVLPRHHRGVRGAAPDLRRTPRSSTATAELRCSASRPSPRSSCSTSSDVADACALRNASRSSERASETDRNEKGLPLLATRGFWSVARIGQTSEWLHVAASITLVLFVLALDAAYVDDRDCWRGPSTTITWACIESAWGHPLSFWFGIGALALMIGIVLLVAFASHTPEEPNWLGELIVRISRSTSRRSVVGRTDATKVRYPSRSARRGSAGPPWPASCSRSPHTPRGRSSRSRPVTLPDWVDGPGVLGLFAAPIALVVLALFLSRSRDSGWSKKNVWESPRGDVGSAPVLLVLGRAAALARPTTTRSGTGGGIRLGRRGVRRRPLVLSWSTAGNNMYEAWRGQGPGVVMLLSLFASMALSSLLVLGAASWLGGPADAPPADQARWNIPDAYEWFAVLLTLIAWLLLLLLLTALATNLPRYLWFSLPRLLGERRTTTTKERREARGRRDPRPDDPEDVRPAPKLTPTRPCAAPPRRRATESHMLHRGEPLFGWLAVFAGVGFFGLPVAVGIRHGHPAGIAAASNTVLAAVAWRRSLQSSYTQHRAANARSACSGTSSRSSPRRTPVRTPVLRRARRARTRCAHADRGSDDKTRDATARRDLHRALHGFDDQRRNPPRDARREDQGRSVGRHDRSCERTALLSYGTQLRAYFGRFFPSVFGVTADGTATPPATGRDVPGRLVPSTGPTRPHRPGRPGPHRTVALA